jgi:serine protease Do
MKSGDWVMAIGNPFNLAHTVTVGVISAIERPYPVSEGRWQRVLQTDAAINPGNSGGPLLNLQGEVIGINTAVLASEAAPRNVGVGFAIPIDAVRDLLPELREGTVTRGRIGVQITPVTKALAEPLGLDRASGALVRVVERAGPAAAAGIEPGDVITRYNERTVEESDQLVDMVARTKPGTTVPVEIVHDGERRTVVVTVARLQLLDGAGESTLSVETEFGLSLRDLTPPVSKRLELPAGRSGAVVTGVDPGGPAAAAGVRAGDVILEVGRTAVDSATEANNQLRHVPDGGTAFVLLWRVDREVFVTLTRERGR